jgi:outer membrane protein
MKNGGRMFGYLMLLLTLNLNSQVSIEKAVESALKTSPIINSYYQKIESSKYSIEEVKLSRYGMLNFKFIYTKGDDPVYAFASKMRQGEFSMADMMNINNPDSIDNIEIGFEYGVPLFTGYKIENYEKIMTKNYQANEKIYQEVKNGIAFKTIFTYLNVSLYQKLKELADYSIKLSEVDLQSAKKLNEKGMIFGSDYYAALSIYSTLNNYSSNFDKDIERELKALSVLTSLNLSSKDISIELKEYDWDLKDENYYIDSAIKNRNSLKAYDDYIQINELKIDMAKKSILPDVIAFFSFSGNSGSISDMKTSSIYGVKVDFPIGKPNYYATLNKTISERKDVEELKKNEERNIIDEIKQTYSNILQAKNSLKIAKETVLNAEKSLELFIPLYRQGKQSIMEVLRANANLLQARSSYYESVFKYHLYYTKIMYLSGNLNDDYIKSISKNLAKESVYGR